jgi:hypothetical protein
MFVTLKVFKLIGPSNDGRRHGRGTYLFMLIPNINFILPSELPLSRNKDVKMLFLSAVDPRFSA